MVGLAQAHHHYLNTSEIFAQVSFAGCGSESSKWEQIASSPFSPCQCQRGLRSGQPRVGWVGFPGVDFAM